MPKYEPRFYRLDCQPERLAGFQVTIGESDLLIFAEKNLYAEAYRTLAKIRKDLENWIALYPEFYASLTPLEPPDTKTIPAIVRKMYEAAKKAGVGPMAAVAGAVAEEVGLSLLKHSSEVIVENGGDIFCFTKIERHSLVYAGKSPFSQKITIKIPVGRPVGICTSSGTVGHSLSFGKADAVVVIDGDTAFADASATAIGNLIRTADDIEKGIEAAKKMGVEGVLIIVGDKLGAWGAIELDAAL